MWRDQSGSMLFEYVIVCVLILSGGSLLMGSGGKFLYEAVGFPVGETSDFGAAGSLAVDWFRRLMWMTAQPFP